MVQIKNEVQKFHRDHCFRLSSTFSQTPLSAFGISWASHVLLDVAAPCYTYKFFHLYLEVPQDLSSIILNHPRERILFWPWDFQAQMFLYTMIDSFYGAPCMPCLLALHLHSAVICLIVAEASLYIQYCHDWCHNDLSCFILDSRSDTH